MVVVVAAAISVSKGATFALHCFALRTKKKRDVDRGEREMNDFALFERDTRARKGIKEWHICSSWA